jgi:hypothetical protein
MVLEYSPAIVIPEQGHIVIRVIEVDRITIVLVRAFTRGYFSFFHTMALDKSGCTFTTVSNHPTKAGCSNSVEHMVVIASYWCLYAASVLFFGLGAALSTAYLLIVLSVSQHASGG